MATFRFMICCAVLAAFSATAFVRAATEAGERWRGFNLEGYALKGVFSAKIDPQDMVWMRELGFNFVLRPLLAVRDAYPKSLLVKDGMCTGSLDGVSVVPLLEFLQREELR